MKLKFVKFSNFDILCCLNFKNDEYNHFNPISLNFVYLENKVIG